MKEVGHLHGEAVVYHHNGRPVRQFSALVHAQPTVSKGVLNIVSVGFATGILGVVVGAVAGLGFWGLLLSYVAAGNIGVASLIVRMAYAD